MPGCAARERGALQVGCALRRPAHRLLFSADRLQRVRPVFARITRLPCSCRFFSQGCSARHCGTKPAGARWQLARKTGFQENPLCTVVATPVGVRNAPSSAKGGVDPGRSSVLRGRRRAASRGKASPNTSRVSFAQVRLGEEVSARVASRRERRRARDKRTKTGNDPICVW